MRRGDFERLIRNHLDEVLGPRGFALTPQPPADFQDPQPAAVYEADPQDFARRYPALGEGILGDVSCVDIWIKQDPETQRVSCDVEGHALSDLLSKAELPDIAAMIERTAETRSLAQQLEALAMGLAAALDANRV